MTEEELAVEAAEKERLRLEALENGPTEEVTLLRETLREVNQARREQEARNIQLAADIAELKRPKAPPAKTPTAEEYFERPVETMRKEIADQIAPLNAFAAGLKKEKVYFNIKQQFINDNKYNPILQRIGLALDNIILNGDIEPTVDSVRNTINYLVGQVQIEDPEFFTRKPKVKEVEIEEEEEVPENKTPNNKEPKLVTPPHLRPSGAPRNSEKDKTPKKTYTENERRLMRLNNQTEEEYEAGLNSPDNLSGMKRKEKK